MAATAPLEGELLMILETQQREIEVLREQVAVCSPHLSQLAGPSSVRSVGSAFSWSPQSRRSSQASGEEPPVDLRRYATLCENVESLQGSLTKLEIKNREQRAKVNQHVKQVNDLETVVSTLRGEIDTLRELLSQERIAKEQAVERAAQAMLANESVAKELRETQSTVERLHNELRTTQLEKQQRALIDIDQINRQLREQLDAEQKRTYMQVTHHIESTTAMQRLVEEYAQEMRHLEATNREAKETVLMQHEELRAHEGWRLSARRRESKRDLSLYGLEDANRQLQRSVKALEASRRRILAELVHTKKQLELVRCAMKHVDSDLEQMNKTIALFRTREGNVTRALREYARRNRTLQDSVEATQRQLRDVSDSLRRSERRKQEIAIESTQLKRGLVVERCQREDLLKQCIALEQCLMAFQESARDSADRASAAQKENAVLQVAVTELSAFSKELMTSQQQLKQQLKHLEVHGQVEPCVFG
ncbi:hypothetical protein ATCC90586_002281 [Pythium insidiosum]|nr:hypothetical protein ATCC90586_002281 [Pythium insidiosum]